MHALHDIQTVIVYKQGILSLWQMQKNHFTCTEQQLIIQEDYQHIKRVVHITVHLQTILLALTDSNIVQKKMDLEKLHSSLNYLLQDLKTGSESLIVRESMKLIADVLKKLSNMDLDIKQLLCDYNKNTKCAIDNLCQHVVNTHLKNHLDRVTQQWISKYKIDLNTSRVLITGPHGPRKSLIEMQYYLNLYKKMTGINNVEDDKCYYVESLEKHIPTIDIHNDLIQGLLAKQEWNKNYGILNNDPKMMSKDVLSKYVIYAIHGLFGKKTSECPLKALRSTMKSIFSFDRR